MKFVLRNGSAIFQRVLVIILTGFPKKKSFVYSDDVIICSKDERQHVEKKIECFRFVFKPRCLIVASNAIDAFEIAALYHKQHSIKIIFRCM